MSDERSTLATPVGVSTYKTLGGVYEVIMQGCNFGLKVGVPIQEVGTWRPWAPNRENGFSII